MQRRSRQCQLVCLAVILRVWKPQGDDVDMNAFKSAVEMQPFNRVHATLCFSIIESP